MARLSELSPELIEHIISWLSVKDILKCQLLAKFFRSLIQSSVALQYAIELAASSYTPVTSSATISERLEGLKTQAALWEKPRKLKQIKFAQVPTVEKDGEPLATHYEELTDNLFVQMLHPSSDFDIDSEPSDVLNFTLIRVLDFATDPPKSSLWNPFLPVDDRGLGGPCFIFPSQDLIIIKTYKTPIISSQVVVTMFSLRQGGPHPKARFPQLAFSAPGDLGELSAERMSVAGSTLVIGCESIETHYFLLITTNWYNGDSVLRRFNVEPWFFLVSSEYLLISIIDTDDNALEFLCMHTCHITPRDKADRENAPTDGGLMEPELEIRCVSKHDFPRMFTYHHSFKIVSDAPVVQPDDEHSRDVSSAANTPRFPFIVDPRKRMLQILIRGESTVGGKKSARSVYLFTPISTFFDLQPGHGPSHTFIHYTWEEWGPKNCALTLAPPREDETKMQVRSDGNRFIDDRWRKAKDLRVHLTSVDFVAIKRAMGKIDPSSINVSPQNKNVPSILPTKKKSSTPPQDPPNSIVQGVQRYPFDIFDSDKPLAREASLPLYTEMPYHNIGWWRYNDFPVGSGLSLKLELHDRWFWGIYTFRGALVKAISILVPED